MINDQIKTFSLCVPCFLKIGEQHIHGKTTVCINISNDLFEIRFPVSIHLTSTIPIDNQMFAFIHHKSILIGDNILLLFPSETSKLRFLVTLSGAGVLIPYKHDVFQLLPKPSFIPTQEELSLPMNKFYGYSLNRFRSQIHQISPNTPSCFVDNAAKRVMFDYSNTVKHWLSENPNYQISRYCYSPNSIIKFLKGTISMKYHMNTIKTPEEPPRCFQVVDQDNFRTRPHNVKWEKADGDHCARIIKSAISVGHAYVQGEFDIMIHIYLLSKRGISFLTDNTDAPKTVDDDFILNTYIWLTELTSNLCTNLHDSIISVGTRSIDVIEKCMPNMISWIKYHQIDIFPWLAQDIPMIYCRHFTQIWKFWIWYLKQSDRFTAIATFGASILLMLHELFSGVKDPLLVVNEWSQTISKLDIDDILDLSSYLLYHYECYSIQKN